MGVENCAIVDLATVSDDRGRLTIVEGGQHIPFEIERIYYLYDVPHGLERGAHAHKNLRQVLIAIAGSFDVVIDDGTAQKRIHLNRAYSGLYMDVMIWHSIENFSAGAVCLALASAHYDEADYYRNYDEFLAAAARG